MKRLYNYFSLKLNNFRLVLKTFLLLCSVRLGLWLLPFATLQQLLANASQFLLNPQQLRRETKTKKNIYKIIWAVNLSSKYAPGTTKCLARALTTEFLMNRKGYSPELRIGVAPGKEGKLEAHAWVENQGEVLIGQLEDLARFTVLPLPSTKVMVKS